MNPLAPMTLAEYKRRLIRIWIIGFLGLGILTGVVKWQARAYGEATGTVAGDVAATLLIAIVLPSLVAVRGYFRYRKFLAEGGPEGQTGGGEAGSPRA